MDRSLNSGSKGRGFGTTFRPGGECGAAVNGGCGAIAVRGGAAEGCGCATTGEVGVEGCGGAVQLVSKYNMIENYN